MTSIGTEVANGGDENETSRATTVGKKCERNATVSDFYREP